MDQHQPPIAVTRLLLLLLLLSPCRNFRTFTAPSAVQFISLAVENSGEVLAAGSQDDFQVACLECRPYYYYSLYAKHPPCWLWLKKTQRRHAHHAAHMPPPPARLVAY
jgi:hypothetical protein